MSLFPVAVLNRLSELLTRIYVLEFTYYSPLSETAQRIGGRDLTHSLLGGCNFRR